MSIYPTLNKKSNDAINFTYLIPPYCTMARLSLSLSLSIWFFYMQFNIFIHILLLSQNTCIVILLSHNAKCPHFSFLPFIFISANMYNGFTTKPKWQWHLIDHTVTPMTSLFFLLSIIINLSSKHYYENVVCADLLLLLFRKNQGS